MPNQDQFFKPEDIISTYTSNQAVEDGILFDVDIILARKIPDHFFIKYITTGLLAKGYWNDRCKNGVSLKDAGTADRCQSCPTWVIFANSSGNKRLPCKEKTLNIANILDLLSQAARIFRKKPADDYFASGRIELPSGQKQTIYIAQNETGRFTAMLPEEY